jgi:hypothetical protein
MAHRLIVSASVLIIFRSNEAARELLRVGAEQGRVKLTLVFYCIQLCLPLTIRSLEAVGTDCSTALIPQAVREGAQVVRQQGGEVQTAVGEVRTVGPCS